MESDIKFLKWATQAKLPQRYQRQAGRLQGSNDEEKPMTETVWPNHRRLHGHQDSQLAVSWLLSPITGWQTAAGEKLRVTRKSSVYGPTLIFETASGMRRCGHHFLSWAVLAGQ